jgi:hypothetical protein
MLFFISEKQLRVYLAPDEEMPERNAQNRDHFIKVMFFVPLLALVITAQETAPLMEKLECGLLWNSLLLREQV